MLGITLEIVSSTSNLGRKRKESIFFQLLIKFVGRGPAKASLLTVNQISEREKDIT